MFDYGIPQVFVKMYGAIGIAIYATFPGAKHLAQDGKFQLYVTAADQPEAYIRLRQSIAQINAAFPNDFTQRQDAIGALVAPLFAEGLRLAALAQNDEQAPF